MKSIKLTFNILKKFFSTRKKHWSYLMVLLILYCAIEIPMDLIFKFQHPYILKFNIFVNLCFILDLAINVSQNLKANINNKKSYFAFWFWIDFLSATPFEIVAYFYPPAYSLHFLSFFKVARIVQIIKLFSSLQNIGKTQPSQITYQRLLNFGLAFSITAHWIALLWILVEGVSRKDGDLAAYINALYWTITTLTTIGYGDITPQTLVQKLFTMCVMVIGVGTYGYVIGNFTSLLNNLDYAKMHFLEKMEKVNTFLNYKKIPKDLQENIYSYYKFLWDNRRWFDENSIMNDLPYSLRMQIALYLNKSIIEKIQIFKEASEEIISEIALQLKPEIFTPGNYIFREDEHGDKMYFISLGEVEILSEKKNIVYTKMKTGDYFGEMALLYSGKRTASVKTLSYCDLYSLDRESFFRVVNKYPEFAKKIQVIAEERILKFQEDKNK